MTRLDLSAGIRRIAWPELAAKAVGLGLFVLLGAGCGAIVRIATAMVLR